MKKIAFKIALFTICLNQLFAQTTVIDDYIKQGLAQNTALQQQQFSLEKSLLNLEEAKSLFSPTVNFGVNYTTSSGGRTLQFPVGDLLNPVYSTLNKLTQSSSFPQIENVNEQLSPKNFYDARFRVSQPLINAEIHYNKKIKAEQIGIQQASINAYKRELVKEIKVAYLNCQKANQAVAIYENTLKLLKESLRVNQSLVKNNAALPMALVRSQNELVKMEAEIIQAKSQKANVAAYLNFLLNRTLDTSISSDSTLYFLKLDQIQRPIGKREEVEQIQKAQHATEWLLKMQQAYKTPKLGTQIDVGSQGSHWNFDNKTKYILFGVSLEVPIYAGNRNKFKIRQTQIDIAQLKAQQTDIEHRIELQSTVAEHAFQAMVAVYKSKQSQIETAERYFKDINRRYKEGQANLLELIDAQTQLTTAQLQQSIALYDSYIRFAEWERATGSYEF